MRLIVILLALCAMLTSARAQQSGVAPKRSATGYGTPGKATSGQQTEDENPPGGTTEPTDARILRFATQLAELHKLWTAGRYREAIPPAEKLAELARDIYGENHLRYTGSLFNLGLLYKNTRQYTAAHATIARAFALQHALRSPSDKAYQRVLAELDEVAQRAGSGRAAVDYYEMALRKLASEGGLGTVGEIFLKARLGRLLRFLADYERAEQVLAEALAVRRRIAGPKDASIVNDLNNLAGLVRARGKYPQAASLYREAIDTQIRLKGENNANTGILLDNLAVMYLTMGQPAEAEPYQKRALAILERTLGPEHRSTGIALGNMAELYRSLRRFSEAEPLFERALAILTKTLPPNHPLLGAVTDNYAGLFQQRHQYQKAYETYAKALAILKVAHGPEHPEVAVALNNIGLALSSLGRQRHAEANFTRALDIARRAFGENSIKLATTYGNLADIRILMKKYDEASADARRAIALIEASLGPTHRRLVFPLTRLGEVKINQGDTARAFEHFRRAAAIYEAARDTTATGGGDFDDSGALERVITAAFDLRRDGGPLPASAYEQAAFRFSQVRTATRAGEALNKLGARLGARDPALRALAREHQDLTEAWAKADKALITAVSDAPARRDKEREARLRADINAYSSRLAEVEQHLAHDYPEFTELSRPRPVAARDLQVLLAPDEALIQFIANPLALYAWAITREEVRWVRTPIRRNELRRLVHALRCGLDIAEWIGEAKPLACFDLTGRFAEDGRLPFATDKAHELYRKLFAPLEQVIAGRKLLIVPADALNRLPMQVLLTAPVPGDDLDTLRTAPWLARRHAMTVLPSVSSLAILRRTAAPPPPSAAAPHARTGPETARQPYLALANPLLLGPDGDDRSAFAVTACPDTRRAAAPLVASNVTGLETFFRGATADAARLRALAPLPDTAAEVCAVARDLDVSPGSVLLGPAATETRLRALDAAPGRLTRYRVLHFATHGLVSGEVRGIGEPALVLTPPATPSAADDGVLTASEVAEFELDADWVILSACNTAAGSGEDAGGGEALSGLARSFFFAGARALLVSHWPVRSDAAVALTTRALHLVAREPGIARSEALRRAMVAVIEDDAMDAAAHPQVWAPFVVVGEGGSGPPR